MSDPSVAADPHSIRPPPPGAATHATGRGRRRGRQAGAAATAAPAEETTPSSVSPEAILVLPVLSGHRGGEALSGLALQIQSVESTTTSSSSSHHDVSSESEARNDADAFPVSAPSFERVSSFTEPAPPCTLVSEPQAVPLATSGEQGGILRTLFDQQQHQHQQNQQELPTSSSRHSLREQSEIDAVSDAGNPHLSRQTARVGSPEPSNDASGLSGVPDEEQVAGAHREIVAHLSTESLALRVESGLAATRPRSELPTVSEPGEPELTEATGYDPSQVSGPAYGPPIEFFVPETGIASSPSPNPRGHGKGTAPRLDEPAPLSSRRQSSFRYIPTSQTEGTSGPTGSTGCSSSPSSRRDCAANNISSSSSLPHRPSAYGTAYSDDPGLFPLGPSTPASRILAFLDTLLADELAAMNLKASENVAGAVLLPSYKRLLLLAIRHRLIVVCPELRGSSLDSDVVAAGLQPLVRELTLGMESSTSRISGRTCAVLGDLASRPTEATVADLQGLLADKKLEDATTLCVEHGLFDHALFLALGLRNARLLARVLYEFEAHVRATTMGSKLATQYEMIDIDWAIADLKGKGTGGDSGLLVALRESTADSVLRRAYADLGQEDVIKRIVSILTSGLNADVSGPPLSKHRRADLLLALLEFSGGARESEPLALLLQVLLGLPPVFTSSGELIIRPLFQTTSVVGGSGHDVGQLLGKLFTKGIATPDLFDFRLQEIAEYVHCRAFEAPAALFYHPIRPVTWVYHGYDLRHPFLPHLLPYRLTYAGYARKAGKRDEGVARKGLAYCHLCLEQLRTLTRMCVLNKPEMSEIRPETNGIKYPLGMSHDALKYPLCNLNALESALSLAENFFGELQRLAGVAPQHLQARLLLPTEALDALEALRRRALSVAETVGDGSLRAQIQAIRVASASHDALKEEPEPEPDFCLLPYISLLGPTQVCEQEDSMSSSDSSIDLSIHPDFKVDRREPTPSPPPLPQVPVPMPQLVPQPVPSSSSEEISFSTSALDGSFAPGVGPSIEAPPVLQPEVPTPQSPTPVHAEQVQGEQPQQARRWFTGRKMSTDEGVVVDLAANDTGRMVYSETYGCWVCLDDEGKEVPPVRTEIPSPPPVGEPRVDSGARRGRKRQRAGAKYLSAAREPELE
ncbi:hypothetical protein GMRT_16394 [Giardia muris]|uniref:Uncharacterized protein n=1 Tax=Giardia muris TaxID=5742 RepID=A0A4Z1SNY9_GIAMU|nr:hypothetical protein GMRT_16394 [Giardia muris]|eukprot:TNJ26575.1 hypothetical protein GMRT_16394 [Giardia muris]